MKLTDEQINAIKEEYTKWKDSMYANRTLSERKDFEPFLDEICKYPCTKLYKFTFAQKNHDFEGSERS